MFYFFFSSRRRHTRWPRDWSSDVCSSDLHLILNVREPRRLLPQVENAGSVFLGPWSPESAGDYASGTNHVLPTGGAARVLGGLSVDSFCKYITVQELSTEGIRGLAGNICALARAEGLEAHAQAVEVRLEALEGGP